MIFVLLAMCSVLCILGFVVSGYIICEGLQHRKVNQAVTTFGTWLVTIATLLLAVSMLFIICGSEKSKKDVDVKSTTNSSIVFSKTETISDVDLVESHIGEYKLVPEQLTFGTAVPGN